MFRIAVDAMGGDHAPEEIIKGIADASRENEVFYFLVGDENAIQPLAAKYSLADGRYEIIHTEQAVTMEDSPKTALDEKPDASIAITSRLLAEEKADAMLSAGNTGGVVLAARKFIPVIEGVERSALATIYPTANFKKKKFGFSLLLDAGATLHCDERQLVHFAIMGHYYSVHILGKSDPGIGLLNIGSEPSKGGKVLTSVYTALSKMNELNFIGNIEGKDILSGKADVIVCEGMLGNVVIKMMEGFAESAFGLGKFAFTQGLKYKLGLGLMKSGLKKVKERTDYSEYGGAPILGFRLPVIKAHGRSNAKAIKNAVKVAVSTVEIDLCAKIRDSVVAFNRELPFTNE